MLVSRVTRRREGKSRTIYDADDREASTHAETNWHSLHKLTLTTDPVY